MSINAAKARLPEELVASADIDAKCRTGALEATEFYRANRDDMDAGSVIAWPERFNHDELSAIQHAMNLKMQDEAAFFAEYQNEPLAEDQADKDELTADQIAAKVNRLRRTVVPVGCNHLTMFVDIQATLLFYVVAAWEDDFTGYVIDYGTYPDQKRPYFTLRDAQITLAAATKGTGLEGSIFAGLETLTNNCLGREWLRDDGAAMRIERCLVDANWGSSTDVVYQFCRQSAHAGIVIPSHGRFVGASSQPFSEYKRKVGDRIGHNWRIPNVHAKRSIRHVLFDTNYWKSFVHARLSVPMGDRGCLSLFGDIADITASSVVEFLSDLTGEGKSAQTHNNYLVSIKQFTRWLVRERRITYDPLAHISRQNVRLDRRHDRRALSSDEFNRLIVAARAGKRIEKVTGADRAMMYVLAAWTGFRKGEIGSLTPRSFRLNANPATATVAACYSKRRREDSQVLHPAVAELLKEWLATKGDPKADELLFPISGKVPGGTERKTNKMMKRDLESARAKWLDEAKDDASELEHRTKSDFLTYENDDGLFADFHSNRHMFITSLEQAGLSPKMAQTLARHSDVRLTLGIYTHIGLHDQTSAIGSLRAPPSADQDESEPAALRATGTDGRLNEANDTPQKVPPVVPSGAEMGAIRLAPETDEVEPNCTEDGNEAGQNDRSLVVLNPNGPKTFRTGRDQSASRRTAAGQAKEKVHPTGLEPVTFGSVDRCSIQLS